MSAGGARDRIPDSGRHYWSLVLLGALLSMFAVTEVVLWAVRDARETFQHEASVAAEVISQRLKDNEAVLDGLTALHNAIDDIDYNQLSLFARQMLESYPHIHAIQDLQRVSQNELPGFERQMRSQGFVNFYVREQSGGAASQWTRVQPRAVYFPIVYLEPLLPLQAQYLGFDVYSNPVLQEAVDAAIAHGGIAISSRFTLGANIAGLAQFRPVYMNEYLPADPAERYAQTRRLVALQLRVDRLVMREDMHDAQVSVVLDFLQNGKPDENLLVLPGVRPDESALSAWLGNRLDGFEFQRLYPLGEHSLRLVLRKPVDYTLLRLDLAGIAIVLVLLLLALLHMRRRFAAEKKYSDEALYRQQAHAAVTLQAIGDAVITTNQRGVVLQLNTTAERLTGISQAAARGRPVTEIFRIRDEHAQQWLDPVRICLHEGKTLRLGRAVRLQGAAGETAMIEVVVTPMRDSEGRLISAILVFHDVSKERLMQDRLRYQSSHDQLTGLIDRGEFQRLLDEVLVAAAREQRQHALCYLDLDHFKVINDTCGHMAGDELLVQLAALLLANVRSDDTLARLGGDEFAVLFYDCPLDKAVAKADALRDAAQDFGFVWQDKTYNVAFGIGVVAIDAHSGTTTDVLRAADTACHAAKARGRNQIHVYRADDPEVMRFHGEMLWVNRIDEALRHHQFQLYQQTIRPIQADEPGVMHCELLMRSEGNNNELISPEDFIPAAERYNLVTDIDRWVVSNALPKIAEVERQAQPDTRHLYGINLSGQSLSDQDFHRFVKVLLERSGVNPASICFEITETAAIGNLELALRFMLDMKALGCRFALDDFGTGVSSYTYLKRFPLDYVKIDGSFIRNMINDPVSRAMVESVIHISRVIGIKTIAEFVEDEATFVLLRTLGVDYAQGYWVAKPAPLAPANTATAAITG